MIPQLEFADAHYMQDCIADQDSLNVDVEIKRCVGLNKRDSYPGAAPEVLRNTIYTRAEVKIVPLREIPRHGGLLVTGDVAIRCVVELRGVSPQGDLDYGDKENPDTVADIVTLNAPHQGDWYVVGVPEHAQLMSQQGAVFYNAFLRRVKTGTHGK